MAYIQGYTNDIFISYSHIDNKKLPNQIKGWVEQFYDGLSVSLWQSIGTTDIKIWWDNRRLDGDMLFEEAIAKEVKESAILLCLNSPSYLLSDYCKEELDHFYNNAQQQPVGLKLGNRSRIVNVLLYNIPYRQWPKELSGTTGFRFHDAKETEADDSGHPLDIHSPGFINQLQDFTDALVKLIKAFQNKPIPPPDKFTIYFGDVADTLSNTKKLAITKLKEQGYEIIYNVPPPFEAAEHEHAVKEKLEQAALAVHLLDQNAGRIIVGEEVIAYPQKQVELSLQSSKSQLIWVPAEMDSNVIEEESYKAFIQGLENGKGTSNNTEYIRGAKSELTQQIITLAEHLQGPKPPVNGKIAVLLDTHYNDQLYALELSKSLLENQIQPFINPQEDDPRKNINILEDRISQVSKLVFLYGKVTRDWVLERMNAALQLIIIKNYPVEAFFIFMVSPHKDPNDISLKQRFLKINVVNNSDTPELDNNALQQFFKIIKAVA